MKEHLWMTLIWKQQMSHWPTTQQLALSMMIYLDLISTSTRHSPLHQNQAHRTFNTFVKSLQWGLTANQKGRKEQTSWMRMLAFGSIWVLHLRLMMMTMMVMTKPVGASLRI